MRPSALITLLLALVSGFAQAEQFKPFDQYEVHYNAFNSSFVTPEIANAYGLQRSKYRALMNVAVLKKEGGKKPSVNAVVTGSFNNLIGQNQDLSFVEIREGESIYYIASFRFTDDEVLDFEVKVQPDPNAPAYIVNFKQHFYVD